MEWWISINRWILFYIRYLRIFWIHFKKHGDNIDKPAVQIYVNNIENRVTFKIKSRYSLELLTPATMKLLWSTKNEITKDKNGENVPHLEITEVILVHCNIVNNDYQEYYTLLFQINLLVAYWKFLQQIISF